MFLKLTDSEHYLSMSMIIANLAKNGFSAGKRTIKEDIDVLVHMGYDIEYIHNKGYHLRSRPFSLSILKILADAIASFRFLTVDDSEKLLVKAHLCSALPFMVMEMSGSLPNITALTDSLNP